jgi:hypothetical protein
MLFHEQCLFVCRRSFLIVSTHSSRFDTEHSSYTEKQKWAQSMFPTHATYLASFILPYLLKDYIKLHTTYFLLSPSFNFSVSFSIPCVLFLQSNQAAYIWDRTNIKIKLSLCLIRQWRRIGEWKCSSIILDLGITWRWVLSFTPLPLYPGGKETPVPIG